MVSARCVAFGYVCPPLRSSLSLVLTCCLAVTQIVCFHCLFLISMFQTKAEYYPLTEHWSVRLSASPLLLPLSSLLFASPNARVLPASEL
jgi:hypothetical protein